MYRLPASLPQKRPPEKRNKKRRRLYYSTRPEARLFWAASPSLFVIRAPSSV